MCGSELEDVYTDSLQTSAQEPGSRLDPESASSSPPRLDSCPHPIPQSCRCSFALRCRNLFLSSNRMILVYPFEYDDPCRSTRSLPFRLVVGVRVLVQVALEALSFLPAQHVGGPLTSPVAVRRGRCMRQGRTRASLYSKVARPLHTRAPQPRRRLIRQRQAPAAAVCQLRRVDPPFLETAGEDRCRLPRPSSFVFRRR